MCIRDRDQAVGPHGDHARNGNALLLAAGQVVGRTLPVLVDAVLQLPDLAAGLSPAVMEYMLKTTLVRCV